MEERAQISAQHTTGVVVANLGTPSTPTPSAVRTYLREFLSDPKVVQPPPPRWVWRMILELFILPTRPKHSARKYAAIWTPDGSPLLVNSRRIAAALQNKLGDSFCVELGMRYGEPSIDRAIESLRARGCKQIVVLPLFPQASEPTTGTILGRSGLRPDSGELDGRPGLRPDESGVGSKTRPPAYFDHPLYIDAVANSIREHWNAHGCPEKLIISFHGMPVRYADAESYTGQCRETARLVASRLRLADADWRLCFQSRFGRGEWLGPNTIEVLRELGQTHARHVDIVCPGFAADCLETLHEIAVEGREIFQSSGGGEYHYIGALNDRPEHIEALAEVLKEAVG